MDSRLTRVIPVIIARSHKSLSKILRRDTVNRINKKLSRPRLLSQRIPAVQIVKMPPFGGQGRHSGFRTIAVKQ